MYLKVPVPANKGTRLLLRSTNASHLLLLISEPRLGWLDHQHPSAAQPKPPWEHPPADHPQWPGSYQQSHCPLSSFQKLKPNVISLQTAHRMTFLPTFGQPFAFAGLVEPFCKAAAKSSSRLNWAQRCTTPHAQLLVVFVNTNVT